METSSSVYFLQNDPILEGRPVFFYPFLFVGRVVRALKKSKDVEKEMDSERLRSSMKREKYSKMGLAWDIKDLGESSEPPYEDELNSHKRTVDKFKFQQMIVGLTLMTLMSVLRVIVFFEPGPLSILKKSGEKTKAVKIFFKAIEVQCCMFFMLFSTFRVLEKLVSPNLGNYLENDRGVIKLKFFLKKISYWRWAFFILNSFIGGPFSIYTSSCFLFLESCIEGWNKKSPANFILMISFVFPSFIRCNQGIVDFHGVNRTSIYGGFSQEENYRSALALVITSCLSTCMQSTQSFINSFVLLLIWLITGNSEIFSDVFKVKSEADKGQSLNLVLLWQLTACNAFFSLSTSDFGLMKFSLKVFLDKVVSRQKFCNPITLGRGKCRVVISKDASKGQKVHYLEWDEEEYSFDNWVTKTHLEISPEGKDKTHEVIIWNEFCANKFKNISKKSVSLLIYSVMKNYPIIGDVQDLGFYYLTHCPKLKKVIYELDCYDIVSMGSETYYGSWEVCIGDLKFPSVKSAKRKKVDIVEEFIKFLILTIKITGHAYVDLCLSYYLGIEEKSVRTLLGNKKSKLHFNVWKKLKGYKNNFKMPKYLTELIDELDQDGYRVVRGEEFFIKEVDVNGDSHFFRNGQLLVQCEKEEPKDDSAIVAEGEKPCQELPLTEPEESNNLSLDEIKEINCSSNEKIKDFKVRLVNFKRNSEGMVSSEGVKKGLIDRNLDDIKNEFSELEVESVKELVLDCYHRILCSAEAKKLIAVKSFLEDEGEFCLLDILSIFSMIYSLGIDGNSDESMDEKIEELFCYVRRYGSDGAKKKEMNWLLKELNKIGIYKIRKEVIEVVQKYISERGLKLLTRNNKDPDFNKGWLKSNFEDKIKSEFPFFEIGRPTSSAGQVSLEILVSSIPMVKTDDESLLNFMKKSRVSSKNSKRGEARLDSQPGFRGRKRGKKANTILQNRLNRTRNACKNLFLFLKSTESKLYINKGRKEHRFRSSKTGKEISFSKEHFRDKCNSKSFKYIKREAKRVSTRSDEEGMHKDRDKNPECQKDYNYRSIDEIINEIAGPISYFL